MNSFLTTTLIAIFALITGLFIGSYVATPDYASPDLGVKIPHKEAMRKIQNYAIWAGRHSYTYQNCTTQNPDVNSMRLPAGWSFPYLSFNPNNESIVIDSAQAYLGIDDLTNLNDGMQKLELIMVELDENGQDIITETYSNLIRPCPQRCDFTSILYKAYDSAYTSQFTPQ